MKFFLLVAAIGAAIIYSTNIKTASSVLCRVAGGFFFLFIYNSIAPRLSLPVLGVNIISAITCGVLGLPGGALLIGLGLL